MGDSSWVQPFIFTLIAILVVALAVFSIMDFFEVRKARSEKNQGEQQ